MEIKGFKNVTDFNVLPNFKHNNLALVLKMIKIANDGYDSVYEKYAAYLRLSKVNETNLEFMESFAAGSN